MNVFLDLTNLGRGFGANVSQTGIFRATEALTRALRRHPELQVWCGAAASWVTELLLLTYDRGRGGILGDRLLRLWSHPTGSDDEGLALIARIISAEKLGQDARHERAKLMLLNATARRVPPPRPFEVLHSLHAPLPSREVMPGSVRALMIHDLIPLRHPEWMYETAPAELRAITESLDPARDFALVCSEVTANDVTAILGLPRERIFVTPLAADPELFYPVSDPTVLARVRTRYGIPEGEYVLTLCTLEPRKNLVRLIESFEDLLTRKALTANLVLVGAKGWKSESLFELLAARPLLQERVVLPGYVRDEDLAALYSGAKLFAYPSLYEGFGLPVLEAMQCGTPVVTSAGTSMAEVAGDAALLVDPLDRAALAEAIRLLLADPERAAGLGRKGADRAKEFSWERTAEQTMRAYQVMRATADSG